MLKLNQIQTYGVHGFILAPRTGINPVLHLMGPIPILGDSICHFVGLWCWGRGPGHHRSDHQLDDVIKTNVIIKETVAVFKLQIYTDHEDLPPPNSPNSVVYLFPSVEQPLATGIRVKVLHQAIPHLLYLGEFTEVLNSDTLTTIHRSDLDPHLGSRSRLEQV